MSTRINYSINNKVRPAWAGCCELVEARKLTPRSTSYLNHRRRPTEARTPIACHYQTPIGYTYLVRTKLYKWQYWPIPYFHPRKE